MSVVDEKPRWSSRQGVNYRDSADREALGPHPNRAMEWVCTFFQFVVLYTYYI
jgi:hypothetical protein